MNLSLNMPVNQGKLILDYQNPENYADACNEFYDQVWDATANKEEE